MRTHNFYHNGQSIRKQDFEKNVESDWLQKLDNFGNYSYGNYSAKQI